ncbi:serine hydroxymethyltransferase, partial [Candidatus Falkowbacteria bacterium]
TDNHLMVVDMTSKNIKGKDAEIVFDKVGISVSRSTIPNDPNPPANPSGVRFGTPAITTRGMKEEEIKRIAVWINSALEHKDEPDVLEKIKDEVKEMCLSFPLPTA